MTPWSYKMLRHEAITSVTALGDPLFDHFDATYILKENDLLQKFDVIARVDHGPSAEDKESAATFRKFWGAKAELRRFKDGSILESLVWSEAGSGEPIFQQIVAYLLDRHLGREVAEPTVFVATGFRRMLPTREMDGTLTLGPFKAAMTAFDELEKHIRSLEGLPLQLRQIFKADPQLRYASVRPPLKTGQRSTDPYGVVIQFEGSGRWPDDLVAIQRTKIAFLLKIGDLLEEAVDGTTARLGLENETHQYLNNAFLDIVQPSGAAFRLRIQNEREQTLLERQLKDKSVDPKSRDEAVTALAAYKRDFLQAPSHTQAMCTLCTRYPLLSPTVRLVKKWFEAHLLSGHIADEVVELLVVHTFVQPYPWRAPSSGVTGFLRTLSFLARWDWRAEPLIVDLSGDMSASDVDAMRTTFLAWRKIDPSMQRVALFAASNLDPDGVTWTQSAPSKVVAARMTALARSACVVVKDSGLSLDPQVLFTSSTADYDFALHITPKFLPAAIANGSASAYKNLRVQPAQNRELIGYDPVALFIAELKKIYPPSTVLFFHDPQGGETVNGVFAPPVSAARPFKVNLPYSTSPIPKPQDEGHEDNQGGEAAREEVRGNKLAMVHEMARLGGDMVRRVEWRF
ncbi:MAG: hypothetical protein M1832_002947 [Thelocarpon impressellum]|nr:MAG: hypothetical protein M1832_002947 [Thelocarpon impressellum]